MSTTFNKRLLIVWLILTSMTLAYIWIDHTADQNGTLRASTVVTVSAIVIALIKVRIIFREFMEVRHAPPLLCRLTDGVGCSHRRVPVGQLFRRLVHRRLSFLREQTQSCPDTPGEGRICVCSRKSEGARLGTRADTAMPTR